MQADPAQGSNLPGVGAEELKFGAQDMSIRAIEWVYADTESTGDKLLWSKVCTLASLDLDPSICFPVKCEWYSPEYRVSMIGLGEGQELPGGVLLVARFLVTPRSSAAASSGCLPPPLPATPNLHPPRFLTAVRDMILELVVSMNPVVPAEPAESEPGGGSAGP